MSAWLFADPGTPSERRVPISGRLRVGRECAGVEDAQRFIVNDPAISRDHFEITVGGAGAVLVDHSTNGTHVNARRVERGERIELANGDVIDIGATRLVFAAPPEDTRVDEAVAQIQATIRVGSSTSLAVVVGDVVGYTTLTEAHGGEAVGSVTDMLFTELRTLLNEAHGTVINYYGDAIFAGWDADRDPAAAHRAVAYALEAADLVAGLAPQLDLRNGDGTPVRMGWGVTLGQASPSAPSPGRAAVHGDTINLAFRLSGLASRGSHGAVLVSDVIAQAAPAAARYGEVELLTVKGRATPAGVRSAAAP